MELIKKNIHMDRIKCSASTQITMEEDINISDQKPDAFSIVTQKGKIVLEEIRKSNDYVTVKGYLSYDILYLTDDEKKQLGCIDGKVSFEEKVHMEGVSGNDAVVAKPKLEDLSAGMINSRKISIHALVFLDLSVEELYDEEAVVDIANASMMELLKKPMSVTALAVDTKDIFRIKEEAQLPAGMPNIFELIWKDIQLCNIEFKVMDGKISVSGEINIFFLYEGEGEERPIRYYEVTRPFGGVMDVSGCREDMILDVDYEMEHEDIEVRPDFDGEERIIGIDIAIGLAIKLMETQTIQVITDVYGIMEEITPHHKEGTCKNLLMKNTGKMKVAGSLKVEDKNLHILQICHTGGKIYQEETKASQDAIEVAGVCEVECIYITGNDEIPYASVKGTIPFTHTLEIPEMSENDSLKVTAKIEQMNAAMADAEEIDVKAVLSFSALAFKGEKEPMLTDVEVGQIDHDKTDALPGMVVYVAKDHDHIWNVGKRYCVPMKSIREVNHLTRDELKAGEKILVVKEI